MNLEIITIKHTIYIEHKILPFNVLVVDVQPLALGKLNENGGEADTPLDSSIC